MTDGPWLHWAEPVWDEAGTPSSPEYGDVYFSKLDGLAESHHVFIRGNALEERFSALDPGATFVVAETGFGTGLNILALLDVFLAHAPASARLHIFSIEKHPLHPDDIRRAAVHRGVPGHLTDLLLDLCPEPLKGLHRRSTADGRITLSLYFGDVREALDEVRFGADAWFLDGFSPARNPDMWADDVLERIRHHTAPGGTLATFTAAGRIRRTLAALGFVVEKAPGFGHKRDMTRARLPGHHARHRPGQVVIIGAGIAGACLARQLAGMDVAVTVLEKGAAVASGASGNPQGALYFKPGVDYSPHTALHAAAYGYARRFYALQTPEHWHPTGLLALACSEHEARRQARFLSRNTYGTWIRQADPQESAVRTGLSVPAGGLWFPGGGWLRPARIVRSLLDHPRIRIHTGATVTTLRTGLVNWRDAEGHEHECGCDAVVLAAGAETRFWLPPAPRPVLKPIRGQVISARITGWPVRTVICADGYMMPADHGEVTLGASFRPNDDCCEPSNEETRQILRQAAEVFPESGELTEGAEWVPRVSVRAAAPDYMPVIGQLAPGVHVLSGLGSKGFLLAPLLSAHLADTLSESVPALPQSLARRVDISRFQGMEPPRECIFCSAQSEHGHPDSGESGGENSRAGH